ncbi:MAG: DUF59 domain-containing protein, partial [Rhodobacteraceae bacterium]|nr:DUF59 domain-containing protein [Paracoccaceae bacterium]
MAIDRAAVLAALAGVNHPAGGNIVDKGLVRALNIDGGEVRFVIEAASAAEAQGFEPVRLAAHEAAAAVAGVAKVTAVLTAHGPAA